MTDSTRRRVVFVALLSAIVLWLWQCTGAFEGDEEVEAIDVFGPWLDDDAEAFAAVLGQFSGETGIEVRYTGSNDFDRDLRQRLTRGIALPDVAVIPQPGLIAELFARGFITPLDDETVDAIVDNYPFTREQLSGAGAPFLLPYRANVKSLVWYRPDVFEDRGWAIPETLDELHDLVNEISEPAAGDEDGVDDDIAPWCFTIADGTSTGWAATDWIEDLLLRRSGPDVYDRWLSGELAFTDDAVRDAIIEFDELVLESGRTAGGVQRVLGETVEEAPHPLFADPPGCAMYKQANFATSWFPDDVSVGDEVDFFVLPGVDADDPAPLLRAGDGLIKMSDREEVDRLLTFLAGPDGADAWLERGGYLSNRDTIEADEYGDAEQPFAELLQEGRPERFDASDVFLSEIRDVWLEAITSFIAESGRLDELAGVDDLLAAVDEVRSDIYGTAESDDDPDETDADDTDTGPDGTEPVGQES